MAGWSKVCDDVSTPDSSKTLQKLHSSGFLLGVEVKPSGYLNLCENEDFRCLFNQLVSEFLKEICAGNSIRPLPPMIGDGKTVDLLKLYLLVREKGGFESVTNRGLWGSVAKDLGFNLGDSSSLKLVYVKYLELLEKWFEKIFTGGDSKVGEMDLKTKYAKVGDLILDWKKKVDGFVNARLGKTEVGLNGLSKFCGNGGVQGSNKRDIDNGGVQGSDKRDIDNEKDVAMTDTSVVQESESSRKRKRECHLALMGWVRNVAMDPCVPSIGSLPERSKWKSYGNELVWKHVLLAREAMLVKRNMDSSAQIIWETKHRMHPAMYDDPTEKSRCSQRIISAKESRAIISSKKPRPPTSSSSANRSDPGHPEPFFGYHQKQKKVPVGPFFQAEVPEWTGKTFESEDKWLGCKVWPPEKGEVSKSLIERDRIGKGRHGSCGCQFPGSVDCVRFHIAEKRKKVKLELGTIFSKWKFGQMGDEVSLSWTCQEEKDFENIVKSNLASQGKDFWLEIRKFFKSKSREDLVSYYFNVYLVRRRAQQNRCNPSNIDSDDDEPDNDGNGLCKTPGSILCSPKKAHLNFKR